MNNPAPKRLHDDYEALRRGVGARVLARDSLRVHGPEATSFLQGQLSCDVSVLGAVGSSLPGLLLEPNGKLCSLVRVTRVGEEAYVLDTDAGFGDPAMARLRRFKLRTKAEVERVEWPVVGVRGAGVPGALALPESPDLAPPFTVPVSWNTTRGVDIVGPGARDAVPEGARWVEADAWEALRVEAGIPEMGRELDAKTIAFEAGLVERTVSFSKGCYTGQELIARLAARGSKVARRLVGVVFSEGDGSLDPSQVLGAPLRLPGEDAVVGRCASAAWCPGLETTAALGYLHRKVEVPAALECTVAGAGGVRVEARPLPIVSV